MINGMRLNEVVHNIVTATKYNRPCDNRTVVVSVVPCKQKWQIGAILWIF